MRKESIIINVIFDPGKGNITVSSREAVKGQPFGALPRPVRTGYSFEGWYLNGEAVSEETMVESEEDICLVARWAKKKGNRKTSMLKKQKLAVALLSAVTAILILTLFVVNHIVAIYGLVDTYYDDSGVEYTEKYYVKKKQGVYGLYDRNGDLMSVNSDGYYIAHSGNQYKVDAETGEYSLYAVVDYDKAGGEDLGYSDRILMVPQITQKNTYSIEVKNQYGGYTFYRDENGDVHIKGTEEAMVSYDQTLFARLCVSCGYTLTMQKLDFTSEKSNAPRLEDGSIDYSAYGLVDRYDAEGNLTYTPSQYTITQAIYADDGTCTADPDTVYTVKVGDAILSGGGYYVQLEGRDSVYILSSTLQATVLQPIESMVTPMVSSPTTITSQAMLINFLLGTVDVSKAPESKEDADALNITPITSFSYQDLEMRTKTLYSAIPYVSHMDLLKGYEINGERVNEALVLIHQMEFLSCKKLGITADALREYGLAENVYYLSFGAPVLAEDNSIDYYIENTMLISQKTENNTYYIASFLSDMIVEVDQYYLSFLEWDQKEWYHLYIFDYDASYIKELSIRIGDK
ncbi:MAG: InlB B-repeat-containing protein, partial [Clostridia bacterium]|nr:InlB B-repeat-containing protein [Clostridia bacterium]